MILIDILQADPKSVVLTNSWTPASIFKWALEDSKTSFALRRRMLYANKLVNMFAPFVEINFFVLGQQFMTLVTVSYRRRVAYISLLTSVHRLPFLANSGMSQSSFIVRHEAGMVAPAACFRTFIVTFNTALRALYRSLAPTMERAGRTRRRRDGNS